jgi:hypothetical protein
MKQEIPFNAYDAYKLGLDTGIKRVTEIIIQAIKLEPDHNKREIILNVLNTNITKIKIDTIA